MSQKDLNDHVPLSFNYIVQGIRKASSASRIYVMLKSPMSV